MNERELLLELFGRIPTHVAEILDGLEVTDLLWRPGPTANPVGWSVWHLGRVVDHQVADVAGVTQVWMQGDWARGFGLTADPDDTGYGHTPDQVAAVKPRDRAVLGGYVTRVWEQTEDFLFTVGPDELARVVDPGWNPPVTLGVRLVSIADDAIQHAGEAKYVKGLLPR